MKRTALFTLALLTALGVAVGSGAPARAALPPLIDRALIFGDPEIAAAQLSPDGRYMSFIKPYKNVRNVWVKGLAEPFGAARAVTGDARPVTGYF